MISSDEEKEEGTVGGEPLKGQKGPRKSRRATISNTKGDGR